MNTSKLKFIALFFAFALAFVWFSASILDQRVEVVLGSQSSEIWKNTLATFLSPVKMVLVGPLIPFIDFLHQDPDTPPPFFLAGFVIYWACLALLIHFLLTKFKGAHHNA